jgi:hypothetical protein
MLTRSTIAAFAAILTLVTIGVWSGEAASRRHAASGYGYYPAPTSPGYWGPPSQPGLYGGGF